jgi:hypothetical protein
MGATAPLRKSTPGPFWALPWGMLRDLITCLSFANLCFLRPWGETLSYRKADSYFMKEVPTRTDYLATVTAVVLLAFVLWGIVVLCRRKALAPAYSFVRFAAFGLVLLPLNGLRASLSGTTKYMKSPLLELITRQTLFLVILPLLGVLLWFAWKYQNLVVKIAVAALIALFPFCAVTFGHAIWAAVHVQAAAPDGPLAPRLPDARTAPRLLWVIFDEWDYRLTFRDRPAGLAMPAVERVFAQAISATNARSPAMDTATSLPSLITGRRLRMTVARSDSHFSAEEVEGVEQVAWRETPTLFSAARQMGFNTAVVGWYLPYCRMFTDVLTDCAWWPMPVQATSMGGTFPQKVYRQTRSLFETDSLSLFGQSLATQQKTALYLSFLQRAELLVADSAAGCVLLHVPVPHAPHPYNRLTGRFDLKNEPLRGYIDSLALLDGILATLRRDMEKAGLWDKTTVLLSADHPFREAQAIDGKFDVRIPFLLKMAGQQSPASFGASFNSIVSADLLLAALKGEIATVPEALAWLDRHHRDAEDPVPSGKPE